MLTGNVQKFSWKAVGQAAVGSAITAGVGSVLNQAAQAGGALNGTQVGKAIADGGATSAAIRAGAGSAASMAVQGNWNWRNIGISAISAGAGSAMGAAVGSQAWAQAGNGVGQRLVAGLVGGLTSRALTSGRKSSYESVFASTLGNAIGESLAAEIQPKRDWLAGANFRLGGSGSAEAAGSTDQAGIGLGAFSSRLGQRALDRMDAALTAGDVLIAQRAYAGGGSGGGESEVLPYRYLARDGSGHNTPQTAVLIEGRATRDWLELDRYDEMGNRTGHADGISAEPSTMSYGDQMRNALWGTGQLAYGGVKGAVNGVPAFVVGTVKGYSYIGAGLRDGFDSLVGNRSSNYLDRAIQAGTPYTGEIWSYDNGLQRLGGYGGELVSPAAYSAGLRVGGRLGTAFIDGIGTGPLSGSRSAQRGAIFLGDEGKTFGKLQGQGATFGRATSNDYRATFFAEYPDLKGQVVVHHGVEQQVLTRYPGVVSEAEMHSLENLRGIPKEMNSQMHLSEIRREWNQFYRANPTATQAQLLAKATEIDARYGTRFNPPIEPGN
jgi:hypothetical protein